MAKSVTLKDIAKLANVSVSTVSRVVNNSQVNAASLEVQNRIWEIVRELEYSPNITARNLKLQSSKNKKVSKSKIIACIFARSKLGDKDPFFSEIARGIELQALKKGYVIKYFMYIKNIKDLGFDNSIDGVVVLGRAEEDLLMFLKSQYKHVVYTGLNKINEIYDQVICDGYLATEIAMDYLKSKGHKYIAFVGETKNEIRYNAYCEFLSNDISKDERKELLIESKLEPIEGYNKVIDKIKDNVKLKFSAIFCCNDQTAIGVLKALQSKNILVPQEVSVISIDDIDISQYLTPMLTTIHIPTEYMGIQATKLLVDRIEEGNSIPVKIELQPSLVCRESVGENANK